MRRAPIDSPVPWHRDGRNFKRPAIKALVARLRREGRCALCRVPGPALQFHHLGIKTFDIGSASRRTPTATRIEIGRTTLLCRGCHDGIHLGVVDGSDLTPLPMPDLTEFVPPIEAISNGGTPSC